MSSHLLASPSLQVDLKYSDSIFTTQSVYIKVMRLQCGIFTVIIFFLLLAVSIML